MKVGSRAVIVIAAVLTLVFLRLGFWQVSRLKDRKALNAELASRARHAAIPISELPTDTAKAHYRRVDISGTYDYENEIILTLRSRDGSPGVNIITPVRTRGGAALVVVRGWVYSPDGMTVDLARWREDSTINGHGFIETFPGARRGRNQSPTHPNAFRWLDRSALEKRFHYAILPYYVVLTTPGDTTRNAPPRLSVPPMDEGPHQSYAIQWFSFAAISIIGTIIFLRRK
ncbi:MAG TPA: SURF1 family protein [Gemmatimonadaceae bacterium]|nr:SURF1 family protein [Gemmatimonadaceae bacterium]